MSLMNKTRLIYLWTHRPASFTHCFSLLFLSISLSPPLSLYPLSISILLYGTTKFRQGHGYLWLVGFYLYCFSSNITINVHDRSEANFDSIWQFHSIKIHSIMILSRSIISRSIPSRRFHSTTFLSSRFTLMLVLMNAILTLLSSYHLPQFSASYSSV